MKKQGRPRTAKLPETALDKNLRIVMYPKPSTKGIGGRYQRQEQKHWKCPEYWDGILHRILNEFREA